MDVVRHTVPDNVHQLHVQQPSTYDKPEANFFITSLRNKLLVYLHIIHLLKSSIRFELYPAHLQEVCVVIVYMQPLVSSLSAGDCLVHRLRKSSFLTGAQDSHLQRVTIPETACLQLRSGPPENEQGMLGTLKGF